METAMQQAVQAMIDTSLQVASAQMSTTTEKVNKRLDELEEKMGTIDTSSKAADAAFATHQANVHCIAGCIDTKPGVRDIRSFPLAIKVGATLFAGLAMCKHALRH